MPKVSKPKEQERAPPGGWLGPRTPDGRGYTGPTEVVAVAKSVRNGSWVWKANDSVT